jgi:xylulokinase
MWYAMGVVLSAGGSLRWWRDILFPEHPVTETYDDMLAEGAEAPPGSDGLIFLPYLTGERTPHGDPDARGVFFGLSLRHRRAHLTRSVIEGVSFALADSAELMRNLGVQLDAVRVTGGGARSEVWRAILASLLEARVLTAFADAGPAFGAAVLAGAGTGVWASIAEATDALVQMTGETTPDPVLSGVYARYHRVYDSLYPALAGSFHNLTGLAEMKG